MGNEFSPGDVTLAIIAGGAGERMGSPKVQLRIGYEPILSWFHRRVAWPGPTMIVTTSSVCELPGSDCFDQVCIDRVNSRGPLQGILTALENVDTPTLLAIAVDMPAIEARHLNWLLAALATMPRCRGLMCETNMNGLRRIEPFPSAFRREAKEIVAGWLELSDGSMHGLCEDPLIRAIPTPTDWPLRTWANLNSPADFAEFQEDETIRGTQI